MQKRIIIFVALFSTPYAYIDGVKKDQKRKRTEYDHLMSIIYLDPTKENHSYKVKETPYDHLMGTIQLQQPQTKVLEEKKDKSKPMVSQFEIVPRVTSQPKQSQPVKKSSTQPRYRHEVDQPLYLRKAEQEHKKNPQQKALIIEPEEQPTSIETEDLTHYQLSEEDIEKYSVD